MLGFGIGVSLGHFCSAIAFTMIPCLLLWDHVKYPCVKAGWVICSRSTYICTTSSIKYNQGVKFLFFQQIPIFSYFSAKFLFFLFFSQFAVEFFILGFFSGFIFFQCGNMCTERAVLWENFSHGIVWVRFSHKSLTNVWGSVDLTSPPPRVRR